MAAKRSQKRLCGRAFGKKWKDLSTGQRIAILALAVSIVSGVAIPLLLQLWPNGTYVEDPQIDLPGVVDRVIENAKDLGRMETLLSQSEREKEDLKKQLTEALERVGALQARGDDAEAADAIREVRESGDTAKLLAVLIREREKHQEERIKLNREIATVAFVRGEIETAQQAVDEVLAVDPNDLSALNWRGTIHWFQGRLAEAEHDYRRVLELAKNDEVRAIALGTLGVVYYTRGDLDQAEQIYRQALAIDEKLGRREGMAVDYQYLGIVYEAREDLVRDDLAQAEQMYHQALTIYEQLGRREGIADGYANLGRVYQKRKDLEEAEQMYRKALTINKQLGQREGMAASYRNLGLVYMRRGDLEQAEQMYRKALAIHEELGRQGDMANDYASLGNVYHTREDLERAEQMYRKSLAINEQLGRLEGIASDYANMGLVYEARGDLAQAREYWQKARELFTKVGQRPNIQEIQALLDVLEGKE